MLCYSLSYDYNKNDCYTDSHQQKSGFPLECTSDSDCVSILNEEVTTSCSCKYLNTKGKKYCESFPSERGNYLKRVREIG